MTDKVTRQVVDAFYDAYTTGDRDKLAVLVHDDVEWLISGPIDVLHFCGRHRGKPQVLDLVGRLLPHVLTDIKVTHEAVVIDGDSAAILNRLVAHRADGRSVGYRFSHFLKFTGGKLIEIQSITDSYNAVEQILGHSLTEHADDLIADAGEVVRL